jgi:hypothetical protein
MKKIMMTLMLFAFASTSGAAQKVIAKFKIPNVKEIYNMEFTIFADLTQQIEIYKGDKRHATCRYSIKHVTYQDRSVIEQAFFSLDARTCDVVGDFVVDETGLLNHAIVQLRPYKKRPSVALFLGLHNVDTLTVDAEKLDKKALKTAIANYYKKILPSLSKQKSKGEKSVK